MSSGTADKSKDKSLKTLQQKNVEKGVDKKVYW